MKYKERKPKHILTEKFCFRCEDVLPIENFYIIKIKNDFTYSSRCRECVKKENEFSRYKRTGGVLAGVSITPNTYRNEEQKVAVFNILQSFGWSFNDEGKFWWKSGIREQDGTWSIIKDRPIKIKVFPTLNAGKTTSDEIRVKIKQLKKEGYSALEIKQITGVGLTTVYNHLK